MPALTAFKFDGYMVGASWGALHPSIRDALREVCQLDTIQELRAATRIIPMDVLMSSPALRNLQLFATSTAFEEDDSLEDAPLNPSEENSASAADVSLRVGRLPGIQSLVCTDSERLESHLPHLCAKYSPAFQDLRSLLLVSNIPTSPLVLDLVQKFLRLTGSNLQELQIQIEYGFSFIRPLDLTPLTQLRRIKLRSKREGGVYANDPPKSDDETFVQMLVQTLKTLEGALHIEEIDIWVVWEHYQDSHNAEDGHGRHPDILRRLDSSLGCFADRARYPSLQSVVIRMLCVCMNLSGEPWEEVDEPGDLPRKDLLPTLHSDDRFRLDVFNEVEVDEWDEFDLA
ncbi:hypothetical protein CC2G_013208 [Coprinopsis cinerea AmutBmut pab1-1]|nr:hypothetical protein CC2G_013208 [Coprinopsis cinerea AmutBmut pab1-1]